MTARHFIENGYLEQIFEDAKSGDYLLVQFGTNDGNKNATYQLDGQTIPYFLDPATDFKDYLKRYVEGARERGLTPVFVTPPPRNSAYCTGGNHPLPKISSYCAPMARSTAHTFRRTARGSSPSSWPRACVKPACPLPSA
jgi:hypothetical protein